MRGAGRLLLVGVLWAAACADRTFDMLPSDGPAPMAAGSGGNETGGSPGAGRGAGGKPAAGRGGSGGRGGAAGTLSGGKGGGGSGGTGLVSEGGAGDEPSCGFPGCDSHCKYGGPTCIDCRDESSCALVHDRPHCSEYSGCVACRPAESGECPVPGTCDTDCGSGQRCDDYTYTCQPDCKGTPGAPGTPRCPASRPFCDQNRDVCVECDPSPNSVFTCADGLACSPVGDCHPCAKDVECGLYRTCSNGHCVASTPPSP
jgi:hypothetical protein